MYIFSILMPISPVFQASAGDKCASWRGAKSLTVQNTCNVHTSKAICTYLVALFKYYQLAELHVSSLTRAWLGGGGYLEPPSRFSAIVSKLIDGSSRNFQYPQLHQFYTLYAKESLTSMIDQPQMTSEWRHVRPILMQNKVLREPLSRAQFLR